MDKTTQATELVRSLIAENTAANFRHSVRDPITDKHYLVTVQEHQVTGRIEKLLESVLYPAASNVCKICGK